MPEPTEPAKPAKPAKAGGSAGPSKPAQDPAAATPAAPTEPLPRQAEPPTAPLPSQAEPPTAPLPAAAAPAATQAAAVPSSASAPPAGPPSGPPAGPPSGPPAAGPPPGGPPFGGPPAASPPPKGPGLWRQATSTTGGTIAVIVAGCLAALMVLGVVATIGIVAMRHGHDDRIERVDQARDRGGLPPGMQRKLDRLPQAPNDRRGQGPGQPNGQPNGPGNGQGGLGDGAGGGMGALMRGAMGLGNVQHGEFTVQDNGKATVMTLQRGEVTKASATSVTVKSADDFTATYVVADDTRGRAADLKVGDSVVVVAEKAGAKAVLVTATRRS